MTKRLWIFSALVGFLSAPSLVWAESFFGPLPCKASEAFLLASHSSDEAEPFWLQNFGSRPFAEKFYEVGPKQAQAFPLGETFVSQTAAVAVKTRPGSSWQFQTFCKTDQRARALTTAASPWKTFRSPLPEQDTLHGEHLQTSRQAQLSMVNLSQQKNAFKVELYRQAEVVQTFKFHLNASFQRTDFALKIPASIDTVKVRAQGRWTGAMTDASVAAWTSSEDIVVFEAVPETRYFQMRSRSQTNDEAFIVPINNPKLIAESLEQIAHPETARLLVAKIEKGFHGANRDLKNPSRAPWSWQVSEVLQYADFAKISCDGGPGIVEERIDDWIANTGGGICFWNYMVEREVSLGELRDPQKPAPRSVSARREFHIVKPQVELRKEIAEPSSAHAKPVTAEAESAPLLKLWGLNPLGSQSWSPLAPVSLQQTP